MTTTLTLQLSTLEGALASLEAVATEETTFDVGGIPVTLRVLMPSEEIAIQKYAQAAMPGDDDDADNSTVMEYLDRYKWGVCSYAIVQIGPLDFHDVEYVETGAVLENDVPVRVPKHEAVREIIQKKWGRVILNGIFKKYGELVGKVEVKAENLIEFEPSDIDTEIERLEGRVAELKRQRKEEIEGKREASLTDQIKAIDEMDRSLQENLAQEQEGLQYELEGEEPEPGSEEVAKEATPPPENDAPVIPTSAAPPPPRAQVIPQPTATPPSPEKPALEPFSDSFADLSDPESAQALLEAESQRFLAARQKAAQDRAAEPPPELAASDPGVLLEAQTAGSSAQVPPHVAAMAVDGQTMTPAREPIQNLGGVPVYKMGETESLEKPRQAAPPGAVPINKAQSGTANPRFQPPKKG